MRAAVDAGLHLIQLREKNLPARTLFELARLCADITRGTRTRLLVNDRADVARAAGADGVHLTASSVGAHVIRRAFGPDFLIGVSAHSLAEADAARACGADFAVFGPVFDTPSKRQYGPPLGLHALGDVAEKLRPFPLIALGGLTRGNAQAALDAGASGVAGISLFSDPRRLSETATALSARPG